MIKKKINIVGIIPVRMASSRFPGKPLAKICGLPMLGHVFLRSKMSKALHEVYVATCDKEIMDYAESIGAKVIMTKDTQQSASDRTTEAVLKIEKKTNEKIDIIVMLQGDEPMLVPEMVDLAIEPLLRDKAILVTNLMAGIKNELEYKNPNTIKVVVDQNNFALYFSREPIPSWKRSPKGTPIFKQVCVIAFRRDFLIKFNALVQRPLEIAESVDMLRVLEHGYKLKMVLTKIKSYSVDTVSDLRKVSKLMRNDLLFKQYKAIL